MSLFSTIFKIILINYVFISLKKNKKFHSQLNKERIVADINDII